VPAPVPEDAISRASRAWGTCAKGRADAGLRSSQTAEALADAAIEGCAAEFAAIRTAIAAQNGAESADLNTERVRTGTRQMLVIYIQRERAPAASQPN
jgi:hypothetical protein